MKGTLRLDKMLSHLGYGTRSELKKLAKNGGVTVNGKVVKDSGWKVYPDEDYIEVNGEQVIFREHVYVLLNKPARGHFGNGGYAGPHCCGSAGRSHPGIRGFPGRQARQRYRRASPADQ